MSLNVVHLKVAITYKKEEACAVECPKEAHNE